MTQERPRSLAAGGQSLDQRKPPRKVCKVTKKQGALYRLWRETGCDPRALYDCAKAAGYAESSAKTIVAQVRNSPNMRPIMAVAMAQAGITDETLTREHARQLFDSKSPQNPDMPDNVTRHKALKLALELRGDYTKKVQVDSNVKKSVFVRKETIMRAERASGEHIIDVEPEEDESELTEEVLEEERQLGPNHTDRVIEPL